jgi:hypothetical protein
MVARYYEVHASEEGGRCQAPYVAGITNTQLVENAAERLVVEIRYLYRDRAEDRQRAELSEARTGCVGFGERRFTFVRSGDSLKVEEMSGPIRN